MMTSIPSSGVVFPLPLHDPDSVGVTSILSSGVVFPLPLHDPDSVGADDWADERVHLEEVNAKPEEIAADGGQDQGRLNNTPIRTLWYNERKNAAHHEPNQRHDDEWDFYAQIHN